jgi:hypothetical protein
MNCIRLAAVAVAATALVACNRPEMRTTETYVGGSLPRPDHVLVSYFAVSPDQVRLDQGVGPRLLRLVGDSPAGGQASQAARDTQAALAEQLVTRLRKYGLPAEIAGASPAYGSNLLVQGQIVNIDQGNRTRRVLIGLGSGKSAVAADTQIYYAAPPAAPRFLSSFEGEANSGHMPGAAETMGGGAAAQRIGTSAALTGVTHAGAETRRTTDSAEADSLADGIAKKIGQFAATQGWIPVSAVK